MISLSAFLCGVQENAARIHSYELGHDGSDGTCDCIGLIIGAVKLAGGTWPGVHGSNWAARNAVTGLRSLAPAKQTGIQRQNELFLGEIVFKAKEPGESGYNLPDAYRDSPDRLDYYHVGVVTEVNPLCITHCTNVPGGIRRDSVLGKWRWGGKLKYVDYAEDGSMEQETLYRARVWADNGYPVKMRKSPSAKAKVLLQAPLNAVVSVLEETDDTWDKVFYDGQTGYMMRKFLIPFSDASENGEALRQTLLRVREQLAAAIAEIDGALKGENGA